ncbi:intracellular short-chain-length polyhydroxyalkanoate depolymerase [Sutcliffiella horikoshii]|uniref:Alpha/beta hydrolase n=1 Tax=Sutcliffiella horikoshii TaxID=79883 RepID=A0A5D4TDA8_9BACI|nr:alpha/beta hydrolase [Sutcliffiella horikoshii]TYS73750.1 alpha/beta hydrolase [Sutcliffiella horikoshii]
MIVQKQVKLPNGETYGYRERVGSGATILLIHGNMTSSKHWDLLMENIDSSLHLVAVDMRGFGESSYHEKIYSIKVLADDIKLFVDELKLSDFTIIGWSTGGAVAMQFVAEYPNFAKKLILLASASTRGYPLFETDENGQPDLSKRLSSYEQVLQDKTRTITISHAYASRNKEVLRMIWNYAIYHDNQPEAHRYEEYLEDMLTQRNYPEILHALNMFNISHHHNGLKEGTGEVGNINIPVLVLAGENDLVISEQMSKEVVEDLGEVATFLSLKGCGHSAQVDDLPKLLQAITTFIAKQEEQYK